MAARILVVDRNEAFATMLQEMLEADGGYRVETTRAGSTALDYLRRNEYELTIVDVDLDPADMTCAALIEAIRQVQPAMRLMLIPLIGEELPVETRHFDIQGTLSKPFFADDLLPNIQDALTRQVRRVAPPSPPPAPKIPPAPAAAPAADTRTVLSDLARETRANAVLLLASSKTDIDVLAHVGSMGAERIETLATLSVDTVQAARAAAYFLDQADEPFEHHIFESRSSRLYMMALPENLLLVIVTPSSTPLGTIRHNMRRAGRKLAGRAFT
jgi:CheY-like chemotaxis protein/predicted regulator of Ras-like GTPase activity (Roadblock/LC7/MglB family)